MDVNELDDLKLKISKSLMLGDGMLTIEASVVRRVVEGFEDLEEAVGELEVQVGNLQDELESRPAAVLECESCFTPISMALCATCTLEGEDYKVDMGN